MLKVLQARLQQCVNHEFPDVQAGFTKGRGTDSKLPTSTGSSKKQESSRKPSTSALLTMPKPLIVSQSLLKFVSIESVMLSNHLLLCCLLLFLPSIFPSIWVFSSESTLYIGCGWLKFWSFGISPSNEYSGLISFSIDWFDLLAVQETRKCLLQHHSSKATILWHSAFFMVQLSHPYMTVGKIIFLTMWTFVSEVTTLCFKIVTRFVIAFLPKSKCLLISWLQSLSHVVGH